MDAQSLPPTPVNQINLVKADSFDKNNTTENLSMIFQQSKRTEKEDRTITELVLLDDVDDNCICFLTLCIYCMIKRLIFTFLSRCLSSLMRASVSPPGHTAVVRPSVSKPEKKTPTYTSLDSKAAHSLGH